MVQSTVFPCYQCFPFDEVIESLEIVVVRPKTRRPVNQMAKRVENGSRSS